MSSQHATPRQHYRQSDDSRALNMLLRMGTLYEVDFEAVPPRARVQSGDLITGFMPFPNEIGRNFRRWRPVRVGTQVLFASPSGDTRNGVIVKTYNTTDLPQPDTDEGTDLVLFDDGTELRKDGEQLLIDSVVPVTIKAPSITLDGEVYVTGGNFHKQGGIMEHDGINVGKTHFHLIITPTPGSPVTPPMPVMGG